MDRTKKQVERPPLLECRLYPGENDRSATLQTPGSNAVEEILPGKMLRITRASLLVDADTKSDDKGVIMYDEQGEKMEKSE